MLHHRKLNERILKKNTGIKSLLAKLDSEFLVEKCRRQFAAFNVFHNYIRTTDDMKTFVSRLENVYFKFTQQGMTLPDTVLGGHSLVSTVKSLPLSQEENLQ